MVEDAPDELDQEGKEANDTLAEDVPQDGDRENEVAEEAIQEETGAKDQGDDEEVIKVHSLSPEVTVPRACLVS